MCYFILKTVRFFCRILYMVKYETDVHESVHRDVRDYEYNQRDATI